MTKQDRLVKELRLRGVNDPVAAAPFLPTFMADYNRRFAKAPAVAYDAHRPLRPKDDLARIFTLQATRRISRQLTVHYAGRRGSPSFRASGLERWIRWTFLANLGLVLVLALIGVMLGLSLLTIGVITTDAWEVLFATAMVLVAMFFHRAGERAVIGREGQSSLRRNGGG